MIGTVRTWEDDIPGYAKCSSLLRSAESRITSRSLMIVAVILLIRAALVPWILHYSGLRTLTGPSDLEIVTNSIIGMSVMALLSLWAKFSPLLAALIAVLCFGVMTGYDIMQYKELADQGIAGKTLVWVMLFRALMNAIMSKTL